MPIAFSCPYCGNATQVSEQYAGQSGPCSRCGKTITIPSAGMPQSPQGFGRPTSLPSIPTPSFQDYPRPGMAPPTSGGGGGMKVALIILSVLLVGALMCGGIAVALLLPAVQSARSAARGASSSNNLRQITIAIHNYHDTFNRLPPAVVKDSNGKPLYSGYVLLLPFLEQQHIFSQWKTDEPWDSPNNLPLSQQVIPLFRNPAIPQTMPGQCDYPLVGGPGSILDPDNPSKNFADVTDGLSNSIFVIEGMPSGSWAQPNPWTTGMPFYKWGSGRGPSVGMGDGSVQRLDANVPTETLRALETRAGNEPVSL